MPGHRRRGEERELKVQVRVTEADLERWAAHVRKVGGYLSVLIRRAVDEHLAANPKPSKAPSLYDWPGHRRP
jgi:hypothetical protein